MRGRKKVPFVEQSNKIYSYLIHKEEESYIVPNVQKILDDLLDSIDFRDENEKIASEILKNIFRGIESESKNKPKHSGEKVAQETIDSWKQKFPWVIIHWVPMSGFFWLISVIKNLFCQHMIMWFLSGVRIL